MSDGSNIGLAHCAPTVDDLYLSYDDDDDDDDFTVFLGARSDS